MGLEMGDGLHVWFTAWDQCRSLLRQRIALILAVAFLVAHCVYQCVKYAGCYSLLGVAVVVCECLLSPVSLEIRMPVCVVCVACVACVRCMSACI